MILIALLGILTIGIPGCINKLVKPDDTISFNHLNSQEAAGISGQNIIASKVALSLYGDYEPIDIENINSQIIKELNAQSIEINSKLVKDNSNSSEQSQKNEITPASEESDPSSQDQVLDLYSMEVQIFDMINHIRAQNGMQKLNFNPVVSTIARLRSTDMVNRNYFSHYSPEGKHTTDILTENGVMYAGSAEILFRASPPPLGSPGSIINTWLGSNIHRAIILTPQFSQIGISIIDGGNKRVVTAIFLN